MMAIPDEGRALCIMARQPVFYFGCSPDDADQANAIWLSVASAGDVNGDGYSDVIVGAYVYDHGAYNEGGLLFIMVRQQASATPNSTPMMLTRIGPNWVIRASAGDVNGDGYSDVIVGARLMIMAEIQ
ncbi:MAG: FG-GAP repeat protein [Chitinophagaceae bacterium]|nr:FG-GAP repeat protein [Chitinophagaceae bacterium]